MTLGAVSLEQLLGYHEKDNKESHFEVGLGHSITVSSRAFTNRPY